MDPELDEPSGNTIILARMSRFLDGDYQELWDLEVAQGVSHHQKCQSALLLLSKSELEHTAGMLIILRPCRCWLGVIY